MAKTATARKAEVLPPESPDLALVQTDGQKVGSFLAGIVPFFREAAALERKANATLVSARALDPPVAADGDAYIQTFIRTASADTKAVEAHWSVCQTFSALHRRLTAARGRATQPLEEASGIAQRLHNRYKEDQERKAREETDRLRMAAEARARADREAEAKRLEAEAEAAEAARTDLSEREEAFVSYLTGPYPMPERAAQQAGYKEPMKAAARLLSLDKIRAAIEAVQTAKAAREQAAATRQQPVLVEVEAVRPDVAKVGSDRVTWSGEVTDEASFIAAVLDPATRMRLGIPADVLQINGVKLNEFARSLHEQLDRWPGVRAKKSTRTI
jgi:hypothetical protein